jgi:CheY-like chemotaxis protein
LPGVDGIEATRRIRALDGAVARIPVIGISGRAAPGDEATARAAGMDAYLVKPVSPSGLAAVIATATAR